MRNKRIQLSVIIPIYNEGILITELIERLEKSVSSLGIPYELIFIDDHSNDDTDLIFNKINKSSVIFQKKIGKIGKAYSLVQGFKAASGNIICMIDGDLQYPPEEIPNMVKLIEKADIIVANRKEYKGSPVRRIMSRGFRYLFGNFLFNLPFDVQSGLKVFTREVLKTIKINPSSPWTFDLEFLYRAKEAGFQIINHDIDFTIRKNGNSKVSFIKTALEIGGNALLLKFKNIGPQHIPPKEITSMAGAGVGYKKRKYITHTTLPHHTTAIRTVQAGQKAFIGFLLLSILGGIIFNPFLTVVTIVGVLSFIYFVDVLFNLYLVLKSLHLPQEISFTQGEIENLDEKKLLIYSILCPLYKEGHIVPQFLSAIEKIDWPKNKLDILLLLEEDDVETIEAISHMDLPTYVRSIIVPHSLPKTKPKACNYGLAHAKGEYLVVYDAEDVPDVLQLKKAYIAFQKIPRDVICLQAKLNYYNPYHNLLTRFFTAEYSLWFDITLMGLQSINTAIPLGGTSNHFRTRDLVFLRGWDPFNVTEDADLGIRLFKKGYKTSIFDSTTFEEANSNFFNWMRQRSRWLKGYMQTYLVHTREIFSFTRKQKGHAFIFQLIIGGKIAFALINPILWIATFSYFALYSYVGPTIESLYPTTIFYMAAFSLVFGNFLFMYYYMIGCIKREQYSLIKFIFLIPIYWLMISIACAIALYQLIFKPHYWEKTVHGLHLKKNFNKMIPEVTIQTIEKEETALFPNRFRANFINLFFDKKPYITGSLLIGASVIANFLNFVFNAYLGRVLDLGNFALLSLVSSFLYMAQIPFSAVGSAVNYRTGFLEGRHGKNTALIFKQWIRKRALYVSLALCALWLLATPILLNYFSTEKINPFIMFAPVWVLGMLLSVDRGFMSGKLLFGSLAVVALVEPLGKLISAYVLIEMNLESYVYAAVPVSILISFITSIILLRNTNQITAPATKEFYLFPKKFFFSSLFSGLATVTFLSLDIVLASHYLSSEDTGRYALISLVGKMIFFLAGLSQQFTTSLVSRREGAKKSSQDMFYAIFLSSLCLAGVGFVLFGMFGFLTVPILFGDRADSIIGYLPSFSLAMLLFSTSRVFVAYHQARNLHSFSVISFMLAIVQIVLIERYHDSIQQIVLAMLMTAELNLLTMTILHYRADWVKVFEDNVADLFSLLFEKRTFSTSSKKNLRILIVNWRDTRHVWAGGAEVYVHEIAKKWIEDGHLVTIFCGNDAHNKRNEVLDGVQIVRRGGSYTVYIWAFLYYIVRFRGNFDIIVDSENGIPFFTPIYARIPVFLLIHHVHQDNEIFKGRLIFPFTYLARFLEAKIMPLVYRNSTVVTVSNSTRKQIIKLGLAKSGNIEIVNPGVVISPILKTRKTKYPSFLYLGRLKPYKNIDVAIRAFALVVKSYPNTELFVVGEGEMMNSLIRLATHLRIQDKVTFYGKVTEHEKTLLLSQSWAAVQPSQLEGWGITVIEANASGTPVIASNVPGLRDSIVDDQTGILVELRDVDGFATAMITLISKNQFRRSLSESAYAWSQNFTWETSANKFLNIIESEIEKRYQYKTSGRFMFEKNNI